MTQRPTAYTGTEPHVFISYAHKDSHIVYPIIESLQQKGLRIWYDEGIEVGSHWDQVIPQQILASTCMLSFVTHNFLASDNCLDETHFAKEKKKGPLIIYLERVEIPIEVEFRASRLHALSLEQFPDTEAMITKILDTKVLQPCIGIDRCAATSAALDKPVAVPQDLTPEKMYALAFDQFDSVPNEAAFEWFQKAAQQGHVGAMFSMGLCYFQGQGTEEDKPLGFHWIQKAADLEHENALFHMGTCYYYGTYVQKNIKKAIALIEKAMELNPDHPEYSYYLGKCYYREGRGTPHDMEQAVPLFAFAAEKGLSKAQTALGHAYLNGNSVVQDHAKALGCFLKAMEGGDLDAQYYLGICYEEGYGVPKDMKQAAAWYKRAADQGQAEAQLLFGNCLLLGRGVETDKMEASKYYWCSAENGCVGGMYGLANCYYHGFGLRQDYSQALEWYQKAYDHGMIEAEKNIEECKQHLNKPNWWPF